jgi:hypothetical protein
MNINLENYLYNSPLHRTYYKYNLYLNMIYVATNNLSGFPIRPQNSVNIYLTLS